MLLRRPMLLFAVGSFAAAGYLSQPQNDPTTLVREADRLADLFNWADAGPLYAKAAALFATANDRRNALYSKFGAIRGSMETLNLPETSDYLSNQLQSALLQQDLRLRLMCLIVKGDVDGEIDSSPARADWAEALSVANRLGDAKWKSRAAAELGFELFLGGDFAHARKAVAAGLLTAHATGDVGAEIRYLAAIGTGLALHRLDDQALSYLDRSINLARQHSESGYPFFPVSGKIQALINKQQFGQASALIEESEQAARAKKKNIKLAQVLLFKADIAIQTERTHDAVATLTETARLTRQTQSRLFADSEIQLADAYRRERKLAEAERAAEIAVSATGQSRDMYLAPARLRTLADLQVALGHLGSASNLYTRATDIIEGMISNAPDSAARAALLTEMSPVFSGHFGIAAREQRTAEAFQIIEQVRGRIIAERLLQPALTDPQSTQTEDKIRRLRVQLVQAQLQRDRKSLLTRLFFAEQTRWTQISAADFRLVDPSTEITLSDVQRQLKPNELILEYVLGDSESFCLRIGRSGSRIVSLRPRREIETSVEAYLAQLKAGKKLGHDGDRLFALLLEPLHLPESVDSLAIVPDGMLHLLPFSALGQTPGIYTASDHTVWYLPSAGTLVLLRSRHEPEAGRMFLGVGGVEYRSESQMPTLAELKPGLTRADYYGVDLSQLSNLPGTAEEVRTAAGIVGIDASRLLVGRDGTKSGFKLAQPEEYRIIHLAVHGKANEKNPDRAALIFRPNPPDEDGLLEPREILGLHLKADLVVLSACNTAVGHLQGEEGIANLARAFLTAGSDAVISTLWPIDDTYSLFLMKRFYTHLREGSTEAEALRLSQNDLQRKFGPDTPPADWAAFTLLGDGDHAIFPAKRVQATSR